MRYVLVWIDPHDLSGTSEWIVQENGRELRRVILDPMDVCLLCQEVRQRLCDIRPAVAKRMKRASTTISHIGDVSSWKIR
jgi:hypothetical protein